MHYRLVDKMNDDCNDVTYIGNRNVLIQRQGENQL